jgi:hypothetical protein
LFTDYDQIMELEDYTEKYSERNKKIFFREGTSLTITR